MWCCAGQLQSMALGGAAAAGKAVLAAETQGPATVTAAVGGVGRGWVARAEAVEEAAGAVGVVVLVVGV